jgi:hypothetical protein
MQVSEGDYDSVRVVSRRKAIEIADVSERTWERLEALGDVPVKTRLSQHRIGYRICDLREWLDRRRKIGA